MAVTDGLAAYWKFDEPAGSSPARDFVGGSTLTPSGPVSVETGLIGYGRHLPGGAAAAPYLSAPSAPELVLGDRDFTLAMWCRPDSLPATATLVIKGDGTAAGTEYRVRFIGADTGVFSATVHASNGAVQATVSAETFGTPAIGQYCLLVFRVDRTAQTLSLSVNAGPQDSAALADAPNSTAATFYVGSRSGSNGWHGLIGEMFVWGRVITEAEEDELYASGLAGRTYPYPPPDPDRVWRATAKSTVWESRDRATVFESSRRVAVWEAPE